MSHAVLMCESDDTRLRRDPRDCDREDDSESCLDPARARLKVAGRKTPPPAPDRARAVDGVFTACGRPVVCAFFPSQVIATGSSKSVPDDTA